MSRTFNFSILNVFTTGEPFTGNPLCVLEDARGLSEAEMQALAKQFNLSETTFVTASDDATAAVRIFTPDYEMPFAGHPTLGTAAVVSAREHGRPEVTLAMKAGIIPVRRDGERWSLRAGAPVYREVPSLAHAVARLCRIEDADVADAIFVDTGKEQLIAQLQSVDAVRSARPDAAAITDAALADDGRVHVLLWSYTSDETIEARFFFDAGVAMLEDPATGSGCANLGGRLLRDDIPHERTITIAQGAQTGRPSELVLTIGERSAIFVAGRVATIGRGTIDVA